MLVLFNKDMNELNLILVKYLFMMAALRWFTQRC